jgi:hypothetical protein
MSRRVQRIAPYRRAVVGYPQIGAIRMAQKKLKKMRQRCTNQIALRD